MFKFLIRNKQKSSSEVYIKRNHKVIKEGLNEYFIHPFAVPYFNELGEQILKESSNTFEDSTYSEHIYAISNIYTKFIEEIKIQNNLFLSDKIFKLDSNFKKEIYEKHLSSKEKLFNNLFYDLDSFITLINTILNCTRTKSKVSFLYNISNYNKYELKKAIQVTKTSTTHSTDLTNLTTVMQHLPEKLYIYYFNINDNKIELHINKKFIPQIESILSEALRNVDYSCFKNSILISFNDFQTSIITIANLLVAIEKNYL